MLFRSLIGPFLLCSMSLSLQAESQYRYLDPEDRSGQWSLGFGYRAETSPYAGEKYRKDLMPMITYSGEKIYFEGTELGWHIVDDEKWQFDFYSGYLFLGYNDHSIFGDDESRDDDDPLKGMDRRNAWETGFELTRKTAYGRFSLDANQDSGNAHEGHTLSAGWEKVFRWPNWQVEPWFAYDYWSKQKSSSYFGVQQSEATDSRPAYTLESTTNWRLGTVFRYKYSNHHNFSLNLSYTGYDSSILRSPIVEEDSIFAAAFAYRYEFNDLANAGHDDGVYNFFFDNPNPWSWRAAYGYTTDESFMDIVRGDINRNDDGTSLASLFMGRQLSETFFGFPWEIWLQAGYARRFENNLQLDFNEYVLAFKTYFTKFPWSDKVKTRFGFAEGVSYADRVPAVEQRRNDDRDRNTSHFLNYLDYSWDVSIGDVFWQKSLKDCFFGFSIHHRSGIFAASDLYGNVNGGSNVNTLYVECVNY